MHNIKLRKWDIKHWNIDKYIKLKLRTWMQTNVFDQLTPIYLINKRGLGDVSNQIMRKINKINQIIIVNLSFPNASIDIYINHKIKNII